MTYRQLFLFIRKLSDKQLDMDVPILVNDVFYDLERIDISGPDSNVLDEGHPILVAKE